VRHLEPSHLAFRPEPVLASREHPKPGAWLAVEGQDDVHRVLQRPGSGDVPILGHVTGQKDCDPFRLGQADERVRTAPDLCGSAGHLPTCGVAQALVESTASRNGRSALAASTSGPSSRPEANATAGDPQPMSAEGNLATGLLTGGQEAGEPGSRQVRHQLEEKGRLADVSLFVRQDPFGSATAGTRSIDVAECAAIPHTPAGATLDVAQIPRRDPYTLSMGPRAESSFRIITWAGVTGRRTLFTRIAQTWLAVVPVFAAT
jgi:hypothetical protein